MVDNTQSIHINTHIGTTLFYNYSILVYICQEDQLEKYKLIRIILKLFFMALFLSTAS